MKYLQAHKNSLKWILLVIVISIPTFVRMLRPGIYSMQDFPYFRVVEYTKCIQDGNFPCRWAPDAGLGYGEPVFNFYSHVPFFLGAVFSEVGGDSVAALKFVFTFSLFASAVAMFLLARHVWKNNWSALVSSVLYLYAPYRAVNVWVRGALPESFAFVLLPLILLSFERFRATKKIIWFVALAVALSSLILTHNLSVLLFSGVICLWFVFGLWNSWDKKITIAVVFAVLLSLALSAFYLLPAVYESHLVNLQTTTTGYFDFRAHFITVPQLFISRFWGYGGSTWGDEDGLSVSIGQVQAAVLLLTLSVALVRLVMLKARTKDARLSLALSLLALCFLFLTHNKTAFIWEAFSPVMKYIQFPWRFLGVSLFCLSLSAGYLVKTINRKIMMATSVFVCFLAVMFNMSFFREDLWFNRNDETLQSGDMWVEQTRASIGDYWPMYGKVPTEPAPNLSQIKNKRSDRFSVAVTEAPHDIFVPVAYFPGWTARLNENVIQTWANEDGLISFHAPTPGIYSLRFDNTIVREWGNAISLFSFMCLLCIYKFYRYQEKKSL